MYFSTLLNPHGDPLQYLYCTVYPALSAHLIAQLVERGTVGCCTVILRLLAQRSFFS